MKVQVVATMMALSVGGCASVFDGTSEEITVNTNPPGATCVFYRENIQIGSVVNTPGILNVKKRKYDITIKCNKPGFGEASYLNHSGTSNLIAGNIAADVILTAGLSSIVDSADGADNEYDSVVNISLVPSGYGVASPAAYVTPTPPAPQAPTPPLAQSSCTHDQEVQARIAKMNGYTGGPKCD
jgi:hypothetical protein